MASSIIRLQPSTAPEQRQNAEEDRARLIGLLQQAGEGDRAAFRAVYELSSRFVFGLIVAMLHGREVAEEVTQEAYVTIWQRARSYDPAKGNPLAWIATIARNKAIDRLRAERARGFVSYHGDLPEIALEIDTETASVDAITVARLLADLKPEYREALLLSYFRGYTHAELSEALGVPLGTAKSWVRRGLAAMKQALE
ncbi:MAG: sigma-70 family RNA polymerase sigma factor [Pseudomonadota bacterium]